MLAFLHKIDKVPLHSQFYLKVILHIALNLVTHNSAQAKLLFLFGIIGKGMKCALITVSDIEGANGIIFIKIWWWTTFDLQFFLFLSAFFFSIVKAFFMFLENYLKEMQ